MLRTLFLSLTTALAAIATAQINLVPNGSFEDTVYCNVPTQSTLLKAIHWRNPTTSTPDVFDCDLDRICGYAMDTLDPMLIGTQSAFDGLRFAGCYMWDGPSGIARDYAMVRLQDPLINGESYLVSLQYSRADRSAYALDHLGIWMGVDSLHSSFYGRLEVEPQLRLRSSIDPYLVEHDSWEQISDTLVANGGEQWMVIGNFELNENVNAIWSDETSPYPIAYYFFDDVRVEIILETGMQEIGSSAWWDGESVNLVGRFIGAQAEFTLWDASGRLMERSEMWVVPGMRIPLKGSLRSGMYVVQLRGNGINVTLRFVKEEGGF